MGLLALLAGAPDAWSLVHRGGSQSMSGSTEDAREALRLRAEIKSEYLWARRAGQRWVVTDAELLAPLSPLLEETRRLGEQQEALGVQMARASHKLEKRAKRGELTADLEREIEILAKKEEALAHRQEELAHKLDEKVRAILDDAIARGRARKI